jgi:SAM-dependent methyltransferase
MTVENTPREVASPVATVTRVDPFKMPARRPDLGRPRPLSRYAGRWGRAQRWLPSDALRVLDVGCSSGYGAVALLAHGPAGRVVVGVERDAEALEIGRARLPWLRIIEGDAAALPIRDRCADAVLLLDVLEHLAEPDRAIAEAHRVLRPGGVLILSVPHRGALHALDSQNLYETLRRRRPSWPGLDPIQTSASGTHHHYAVGELRQLLDPFFAVERTARTGLGLAELIHLVRLLLRARRRVVVLDGLLMLLYISLYMAEDLVPAGPLAYHVTVRARARAQGGER